MRVLMLVVSLSALSLAGCGDIGPSQQQRRAPLAPPGINIPQAGQPAAPAANKAAPAPGTAPQVAAVPQAQPQPMPSQPATPQPAQPNAAAPGMNRVAAEVGVGAKGHYGQGVIKTPLEVYWRAQERITFDVQIAKAMQLYKAMNDDKGPATHEEFMQKIINENQVRLPQLPAGHRYVYDPKLEKLMVEQPGAN